MTYLGAVSLVASLLIAGLARAGSTIQISGKPEVGQLLSVRTPQGQRPSSYRWQKRCQGRWQPIKGKMGAARKLRLTQEYVGCRIRARVRLRQKGRQRWQTSRATTSIKTRRLQFSTPPTSQQEGGKVVIMPGVWSPDITVTIRWQRCASDGSECADIPGATKAEYTIGPEDEGHKLRAMMTVTDQYGSRRELVATVIGPIPYSPPANLTAPELSGAVAIGHSLQASQGTWSGQGGRRFAYRWQRCKASCDDIAEATGTAYTITDADYGFRLRAHLTLTTPGGSSSAESSQSSEVGGSAPLAGQPTISGSGLIGEQLTGLAGSWSASPAISSWDWSWQRCQSDGTACADLGGQGGSSSGANTPTISPYNPTGDDDGKKVRLRISASNAAGTTTAHSATITIATPPPPVVTAVASGSQSSSACALFSTKILKCWGHNNHGQLGTDSVINSSVAVSVSGISTAIAVAGGQSHSCVVLSDQTVKCWGLNSTGQLGNNSTISSNLPVSVSGISTATAVTGGHSHSCALLADRSARCWGNNNHGQLGNNSITNARTPVPVGGISTATAVTGGYNHSCALLANQTVSCWGANDFGQLGDNSITDSGVAGPVSGISTAIAVASGFYHSCALLADQTVSCWGANDFGQLGDNTLDQHTTPVAVSGISTATAITAGGYHTCALLADQTVTCWGFNYYGQLGDNTNISSKIPRPVDGIASATAVTGGLYHSCALLSDGVVKCWGSNEFGQLGNNSTINSSAPVDVIGL